MDRRVSAVIRDRKGRIVALCNPAASWSPRRVADVVQDIRLNQRSYYVQQAPHRKYLRLSRGSVLETTVDESDPNSLASLPVL